jgi:hypothetical protein
VDSVYQSQITIPVSRLTHTPSTNPTPIIILDIFAVGHIWDGVVTRVHITTKTTSIGITIDQITITKAIAKNITEVISVTATIITKEAIKTEVTRDAISEGKMNHSYLTKKGSAMVFAGPFTLNYCYGYFIQQT